MAATETVAFHSLHQRTPPGQPVENDRIKKKIRSFKWGWAIERPQRRDVGLEVEIVIFFHFFNVLQGFFPARRRLKEKQLSPRQQTGIQQWDGSISLLVVCLPMQTVTKVFRIKKLGKKKKNVNTISLKANTILVPVPVFLLFLRTERVEANLMKPLTQLLTELTGDKSKS